MGIKHRLASMCYPGFIESNARRRLSAPCAAVLMYHEVLPDSVEIPYWSIVRESEFRRQMDHVRKHYEVVSLDEAIGRVYSGPTTRRSSRPIVVITFDDGYAGNLSCALPILAERKLPFTVYVTTSVVERADRNWYDEVACTLLGLGRRGITIRTSNGPLSYRGYQILADRRWAAIDQFLAAIKELPEQERLEISTSLKTSTYGKELRMMTREEIRLLSRETIATIGCHTHGHELLDQLEANDARTSICRAQELLTTWTGKPPRHFCYPNGHYNAEIIDVVRTCGFSSAVTTRARCWNARDDKYTIPRIGIGRFDNLNLFRAQVSGAIQDRS